MGTSADDLVLTLGRLVATHPAYDGVDWAYIALVATFTKRHRSVFGYVFLTDGRWESTLPRDPQRSVMHAFRSLHDTMAARDGTRWLQCLLEVSRQDQTVAVQFEYDDPNRWVVTPATLRQVVEQPGRNGIDHRTAEASQLSR